MELSVFDRLILKNIMPREGDFVTLSSMKKLEEMINFSEEELDKLQFKNNFVCQECDEILEEDMGKRPPLCPKCEKRMKPTGTMRWLQNVNGTEIVVSKRQKEIIANILEGLSEQKKLTIQHYDLYMKFVEDDEEVS